MSNLYEKAEGAESGSFECTMRLREQLRFIFIFGLRLISFLFKKGRGRTLHFILEFSLDVRFAILKNFLLFQIKFWFGKKNI